MSSRITAMDIERQEFSRKMRGYDTDEVRMYLKSVAEEIERLNLESGDMREELGQLRAQIDELRSREKTLQETLVTAQTMAADMKDKARGEGELLIKEARLRSDQILQEAQGQLMQLETDISRSKLERENLEQRLRGVIDQHLTLLDMRKEARGEFDNLRVIPGRVGSEVG